MASCSLEVRNTPIFKRGEVHKGVMLPSGLKESVVGKWLTRIGGIGAGHVGLGEVVSCWSVFCRRNLV